MKKLTTLILSGLYASLFFVYVTRWGGTGNAAITSFLYLFPPLLAALSALYGATTYGFSNGHGRALLLLSGGLFAWFIGEGMYFSLNILLHSNPYPSIADVFYLVGYPLLLTGFWIELATSRIQIKHFHPAFLFFMMLSVTILGVLVVYFGIALPYDTTAPVLENMVKIGYSVGDLLLIVPSFLILRLALEYRGGKFFTSWLMIFVGMILTLAADILFSIYTPQYENLVYPYTLIDLLFIAAYLSFAYGFLTIWLSIVSVQSKLFTKPE